ncbi:MAG: cation diffusion facilitator family transporter [Solirubrobacterales bacterium]|nr:cation diffusion facilitator family transporter [Solirubrobacterales bacterium]
MTATTESLLRPDGEPAGRGKLRTATLSVLAACVLVVIKLVAGLATGSLGLLAEAAHSGTDLVAALLTLFALRVAMRPADDEHQYGHGKAEHLAALGESAFLALVSAFIGYQALDRLLGSGTHEVIAAWWALAILGVVIAIDASRTIASFRAARRYDSPALASNGLHFASDLGGSAAVLLGLVFVGMGYPSADAIAALFVAVLVVVAAVRMATGSAQVLMDRAPLEARHAIDAALERLDDRVQVRRVRTRHAAGHHFVDLVVGIPADAGLTQAHATADEIEQTVREALPNTEVLVHVEPLESGADLRERAAAAAWSIPEVREIHNVRVMHVGDSHELSLHVKLPLDQTLGQAHETVSRLEAAICSAVPEFSTVHTHIEPLGRTDWTIKASGDEVAGDRALINEVVLRHTGQEPTSIRFRDSERGRIALVTASLPGGQPLEVAHRRAGLIEADVRDQRPELTDVIVHTEPTGPPATPGPSGTGDGIRE